MRKTWNDTVKGNACRNGVLPLLLSLALAVRLQGAPPSHAPGEWKGGPYPERTDWEVIYEERFENPIPADTGTWQRVPYDDAKSAQGPLDDNGASFFIRGGDVFRMALSEVKTYRKEVTFGRDGWLTLSYSARDENGDGTVDHTPSFQTERMEGRPVGVLETNQHGGLLLRSTQPLPKRYRIEYELVSREFMESGPGDKTNAPWVGPSGTAGRWSDTSRVNGFYQLAIVDYANPSPRNNRWIHDRRKVCIDEFHDPRTLFDTWSPRRHTYYSAFENTLNMFFASPGRSYSLFMMETPGGIVYSNEGGRTEVASVGELVPGAMQAQRYRFAIERDERGYTLEARGPFKDAGEVTYRFHRDFVQKDAQGKERPIWHYNQTPEEYDGRFDEIWKYEGPFEHQGSKEYAIRSWPAGSAYPDHFIIGDPHTNYYAVRARVANLKLSVPRGQP